MEVFRCAGVLWNVLGGEAPSPRFRVTAASADGGPARPDTHVGVTASCALSEIRTTDLVWVPAAGLDLETIVASGFDVDMKRAKKVQHGNEFQKSFSPSQVNFA
jgi:hypothetical protein